MDSANWVALTGVIATAVVSIFSVLWNNRTQKQFRDEQHRREDKIHKEYDAKEKERQKKEREHEPRIEFNLSAKFFGPEKNEYLIEIRINLTNCGRVRHEIFDPKLRILGIEKGEDLSYRESDEPRLKFNKPVMSLKSILPEGYNFFFVEPGVRQDVIYVTKVSSSIGHILVHGIFHYNSKTPHTAERVFTVGKDFNSRTIFT
jgi:hypothetical protein